MAHPPAGAEFVQIRRRLLVANLLVFAGVLAGFAIAVRTVVAYNLRQQQLGQLTALAQTAAALVEAEAEEYPGKAAEHLELEIETLPINDLRVREQGVQWFTAQGQRVAAVGAIYPTQPLDPDVSPAIETEPIHLQAVTVPVTVGNQTWGYVRTSQTLTELDRIMTQLDRGLGLGIAIALGLSGTGVLWLNRLAMKPIEQSFRRLQQFTADASHELRSPLMAISSNAEVALKYPEGMRADDRETFEVIVNATEQMSALTADLLMLTRTDRATALETKSVDLSELLQGLGRLYQPLAQQQGLDFTTQIPPGLSCQGNGTLLQRACTNLIQNALRYTAAGAIALKAQALPRQIQITVTDTGMGIAPEHL
ncbi:MAG: HAMP domain-containing sensor histidine kinase [Cyanobacteria bacterium]|nr:HAMP domain-containing sensor histidine kinase [Cyanobacteriota bacterium]MDA0865745.1 HAMP domain-containing sensor histidine kinase [Cyanobacteriota bacterium]